MIPQGTTKLHLDGTDSIRCDPLLPAEVSLDLPDMSGIVGGSPLVRAVEGLAWYFIGKGIDYTIDYLWDLPAPEIQVPEDPIQSPMGYAEGHAGQKLYY